MRKFVTLGMIAAFFAALFSGAPSASAAPKEAPPSFAIEDTRKPNSETKRVVQPSTKYGADVDYQKNYCESTRVLCAGVIWRQRNISPTAVYVPLAFRCDRTSVAANFKNPVEMWGDFVRSGVPGDPIVQRRGPFYPDHTNPTAIHGTFTTGSFYPAVDGPVVKVKCTDAAGLAKYVTVYHF